LKTNFNPYTEETILQSLKKKDRKAFDLVFDYYGSALFGIITRELRDKAITEDAFVKIFVKIWKQIDCYKPEESRLFTWMYDIARHELEHLPRPCLRKPFFNS